MRRWLVVFMMFCFCQISIAQKSLVANPKENIIYNGVYTPIQVMLPICNYDSLSVTVSRGNINKIMNGSYAWIVCEEIESEEIKTRPIVFIKAFQNGQLIYQDKAEFRLKHAPDPIAVISCHLYTHSARMYKTHISECIGIVSILDNFDYEAQCNIEYFKVIHIKGGELFKEWKNNGGTFDKHTKERLKQAKKGDLIIFSDITTRCGCDSFTRNLGELEVKIKN